jgi:hypothetical protein
VLSACKRESGKTHQVADGVIEKEIVSGRNMVMIWVSSKIKGRGRVEQRRCHILSIRLHEAISKLIVITQQKLLACFPEIVISWDCELQRFFGTRI